MKVGKYKRRECMPCGMCHIAPLFWRCLRETVQPAQEIQVVPEVQEFQLLPVCRLVSPTLWKASRKARCEKSKLKLKNVSEGEATIRGHQMWHTGCVATRWWISKESYCGERHNVLCSSHMHICGCIYICIWRGERRNVLCSSHMHMCVCMYVCVYVYI